MARKKTKNLQKNVVQQSVRRNNNEGSIFQRKSDGKWVGSVTIGYDNKGRQKKKPVIIPMICSQIQR